MEERMGEKNAAQIKVYWEGHLGDQSNLKVGQ